MESFLLNINEDTVPKNLILNVYEDKKRMHTNDMHTMQAYIYLHKMERILQTATVHSVCRLIYLVQQG